MADGVMDNAGAAGADGVDVTNANLTGKAGVAGEGGEGAGAAAGNEGGGEAKWFDSMPEDMRGLVEKFESREAFEKAVKGPEIPEGDYTFSEEFMAGLDADAIKEATPIFKELGLSQEAVTKLLEVEKGHINKMFESLAKEHTEKQEAELKDYAKTLGQAKFDKDVELAKKAAQKYAGEDGVKFLQETGMDRNPKFIRMFAAIGADMSESAPAGGTGGGAGATDTATVMFSDMTAKK